MKDLIKCDKDINPISDIKKGIVNCKVGIKVPFPIEYYQIEFNEEDIRNWIKQYYPSMSEEPFEKQQEKFSDELKRILKEIDDDNTAEY